MKVLLIIPTFRYKTEYPAFLSLSDFPTGFAYLAAALKEAGHDVHGCNPNNITGYVTSFFMVQDVISRSIALVNPDLVGLGGLCTDYAFLRDAIKIVRRATKAPIVLGGQIVTNDAEFILNHLKPDFCVIGEGEEAVCRIANYLEEAKTLQNEQEKVEKLAAIPNIGFWKEED